MLKLCDGLFEVVKRCDHNIMCELVCIKLLICRIEEKTFSTPKIVLKYDIGNLSVANVKVFRLVFGKVAKKCSFFCILNDTILFGIVVLPFKLTSNLRNSLF